MLSALVLNIGALAQPNLFARPKRAIAVLCLSGSTMSIESQGLNTPPPPASYAGDSGPPSGGASVSDVHHEQDARFICNICLDPAKDPVVTQCGHLYCWPCLFRWLNAHHRDCPVCKAGVSRENVIPIFIEGNKDDPRKKVTAAGGDMPSRPTGQRLLPQNLVGGEGGAQGQQVGDISFQGSFGFFPSLFGLQFLNFIPNNTGNTRPLTPDELHQEHLTRVLFAMGSVVLVCFLVF